MKFRLNGPVSAAYAMGGFIGNMFVDVFIETADGKMQRLRYHVLEDKEHRWYFEPRPDLCPLYSMGLNKEPKRSEIAPHSEPHITRQSESTEILYEAK